MMKSRRFPIRTKLNLLIVSVILLVAAGLLGISYYEFCQRVDEQYYERLRQAAGQVQNSLQVSMVRDLMDSVLSEEFRAVRDEAEQAGDEQAVRNWMNGREGERMTASLRLQGVESASGSDTVTVGEEYMTVIGILQSIREQFGVDGLSLQLDVDEVTWNLVDPERGWFSPGTVEAPIDVFQGYADNAAIPPTYYQSDFGWRCALCEPLVDQETGETVCLIVAEFRLDEMVRSRYEFFLQSGVFVLLLIGVSVLISSAIGKRLFTRPLVRLSEAARSFNSEGQGFSTDVLAGLDIRSRDEIGDLYHDILAMEERIVEGTARLTRVTAERERTETELRTAAAIQNAMLPREFPAFPERTEFELFASMTPAKEVGGDFYDFFLIDDDHLALVIADVSDKGVPAAMFMMASKILLNYCARRGVSPAEILSEVNDEICHSDHADMFVTVWLGILEISTGRLTCSNAGHEYPFLCQGGVFTMLKDRHGLVIGAQPGVKYQGYEIQLQPGDAVFVYTDGVPEAKNSDDEFYGLERVGQALNARAGASPEDILSGLAEDVNRFTGDAKQFDDLTMLCLRYGPAAQQ